MRRPSAPILRGSGPSGSTQQPGMAVAPPGLDAERGAGRDQRRLERPDERPDQQAARRQGDDRIGDQLAGPVVGHLSAALDPDDLDAAPARSSRRRRGRGPDRRPARGSGPAGARAAAAGRRSRPAARSATRRFWRARPRGSRPVPAMPRRSAPARGSTRSARGPASRSPPAHDSRTHSPDRPAAGPRRRPGAAGVRASGRCELRREALGRRRVDGQLGGTGS